MKRKWIAFFVATALGLATASLTACVSMLGPYDPKSVSPQAREEVRPEMLWASFSPDGQTIGFSYVSERFNGIFLMDYIERVSWPNPVPGQTKLPAVHGRVFARLRQNGPRCWHGHPVFSPDGKRIAYVSTCGEPHGDIHVMDRDGGNDRRLTDTADYDRSPSFTPDGSQVFFVRARRYGSRSPVARPGLRDWDIFWVDLTTGKVNALTSKHYYQADRPQISPEGKQILAFLIPLSIDPDYNLWFIRFKRTWPDGPP